MRKLLLSLLVLFAVGCADHEAVAIVKSRLCKVEAEALYGKPWGVVLEPAGAKWEAREIAYFEQGPVWVVEATIRPQRILSGAREWYCWIEWQVVREGIVKGPFFSKRMIQQSRNKDPGGELTMGYAQFAWYKELGQ